MINAPAIISTIENNRLAVPRDIFVDRLRTKGTEVMGEVPRTALDETTTAKAITVSPAAEVIIRLRRYRLSVDIRSCLWMRYMLFLVLILLRMRTVTIYGEWADRCSCSRRLHVQI